MSLMRTAPPSNTSLSRSLSAMAASLAPTCPLARHAGLTEQEVIALHTGRDYRIYMMGFLPGFPYLGGLDERLFTRGWVRRAQRSLLDQWESAANRPASIPLPARVAGSSSAARRSNCLTRLRARCPMRRATASGLRPSQKQNLMPWRKRRGRYEPESAGPRPADYRAGRRPHRLCRQRLSRLRRGEQLRLPFGEHADRQRAGRGGAGMYPAGRSPAI